MVELVRSMMARRWSPAVWTTGLIFLVWFATLDTRHLLPSDEGRYAEIAREMAATGDYITIRYNALKYFEKPPLHMWMTAIAYELFGVGEWQARLWAAISGAIGILATMFAADRWFGRRVALLSGLVLVAAPGWNLGSHFNSLDISVSAWLTCTLAAFLVSQHPSSLRRRGAWLCAAWISMALAVLTKGLIGIVLPGLALVVYTLITRDWALWRRLGLLSGLLCFLVVSLPWFVLVSVRNPEFPYFFFVHEHWQRYTTTVHRRNAPFWYFMPQLLVGFLPWLGLIARLGAKIGHEATPFRPRLLLAVWGAAIFVFFSLSDSKLPGYILPVYPAVAILAALALDPMKPVAWKRQVIWMAGIAAIGLLACLFLPRLGSAGIPAEMYRRYAVWVAAMCLLILLGTVVAWRANRGADPTRSMVIAAVTWFLATTIGVVGHETFGRSSSGVDLVPAIESVLTPDMPIYSVRLLDHTLPFYLRRTTIMVEAPDELEFGTQQEPEKWVPTLAGFEDRWASGPHALALMSHDTYLKLQQDRVRMWPVAQDARRVVVSNFSNGSP